MQFATTQTKLGELPSRNINKTIPSRMRMANEGLRLRVDHVTKFVMHRVGTGFEPEPSLISAI